MWKVQELQVTKDIVLPTAEDGVVVLGTVIDVDAGGVPRLQGEAVELENLADRLRAISSTKVVIRADKAVRYTRLRQILGEVSKAGITNVTFSVTDKEVR